MRRHDRDRDTSPFTGSWIWQFVGATIGILLAGFLGTLFSLSADAFRPKVGDVIAFRPGLPNAAVWQANVPATKLDDNRMAGCWLESSTMAAAGGSLIVEAREDGNPATYRLHWAGARTARDAGDCGPSADLAISRTDLQKLANAAGGFGDKGGQ